MISQLQMELRATCTAWTAWAVALRWVNLAATICDGKPSELGRNAATCKQYKHGILFVLFWFCVCVCIISKSRVRQALLLCTRLTDDYQSGVKHFRSERAVSCRFHQI